jgi:hypothetical protein
LNGASALPLPREIADQLPKSGKARVIVLTEGDVNDEQWQRAAFEQFLRDDPPEDSVYDNCR